MGTLKQEGPPFPPVRQCGRWVCLWDGLCGALQGSRHRLQILRGFWVGRPDRVQWGEGQHGLWQSEVEADTVSWRKGVFWLMQNPSWQIPAWFSFPVSNHTPFHIRLVSQGRALFQNSFTCQLWRLPFSDELASDSVGWWGFFPEHRTLP